MSKPNSKPVTKEGKHNWPKSLMMLGNLLCAVFMIWLAAAVATGASETLACLAAAALNIWAFECARKTD